MLGAAFCFSPANAGLRRREHDSGYQEQESRSPTALQSLSSVTLSSRWESPNNA
jgi:hypothetical protein